MLQTVFASKPTQKIRLRQMFHKVAKYAIMKKGLRHILPGQQYDNETDKHTYRDRTSIVDANDRT